MVDVRRGGLVRVRRRRLVTAGRDRRVTVVLNGGVGMQRDVREVMRRVDQGSRKVEAGPSWRVLPDEVVEEGARSADDGPVMPNEVMSVKGAP